MAALFGIGRVDYHGVLCAVVDEQVCIVVAATRPCRRRSCKPFLQRKQSHAAVAAALSSLHMGMLWICMPRERACWAVGLLSRAEQRGKRGRHTGAVDCLESEATIR